MYWFTRFYNWLTDYHPRLSVNFKFIAWNEPKPVPPLNDLAFASYRKVVDFAFKKHLYGYDRDYIISSFHRAPPTPDLIYTALAKGDLPDHVIPQDEHFQRARAEAKKRFAPPKKVRPVHLFDLRHYPWKHKPSAEEPYTSNKELRRRLEEAARFKIIADARMSVGNLLNYIFDDVSKFVHNIKAGIIKPGESTPLVNVHVKTALTPIDEAKLRLIFGCSKRWIFPMCMFLWPLFRYYLYEQQSPLLWGYETILGGWHRMNSELLCSYLYYQTFVTIDWSGFDLRALFSLMRMIYADWEDYIDFDNGYMPTKRYPTSSTEPHRLKRLWQWCVEAHFASAFRMPDGSTWIRLNRGILSGLFETQFMDSHYNLIMIMTILDRLGFDISNIWIKVQGDDSITALRFHIPANQHRDFKIQFAYWAKYYFDHKCNDEKSETSNNLQNVEVLGYRNNNGYPERDWRKILAVLWNPRSRSPKPENTMARCIGLVYASIYDRNVVNVCRDVYEYYESKGFLPNSSPDTTLEFQFMFDEVDIPRDHFPTQLEVTRYLRSLNNVSDERKRRYWNPDWFLAEY
uniref:RNA dependent RNA polymerase n=1 Tax=Rosellinia necatrix partitivirus 23 TaxID=2699391 RepID=A0A6F8QGX6_9VIRU|nr:RNA dependent RNA polymerase [Rosellinia necatrix partitivirus 23]